MGIYTSHEMMLNITNHLGNATKTIMRYHFVSPRRALKKQIITSQKELGEIWNPHILLWNTAWQFFKWLKIELPYNPKIPLLDIYPREMKTNVHTKTCTQMSVGVSFIIAKK